MDGLSQTLGILGGGQLSRMLAEAAIGLKIKTHVFAETEPCPASRFATKTFLGKIEETSHAELARFEATCDALTFENEFVDTALLERGPTSAAFYPSPKAIRVLQNKLSQKRLLHNLGIPTASFLELKEATFEADCRDVCGILGPKAVLKWSTLGYDGGGVHFGNFEDGTPSPETRDFCSGAFKLGRTLYAERKIQFKRELAIVAGRHRSGEVFFFPVVETVQNNGICTFVFGPAPLTTAQTGRLEGWTRTLLEHLNYVGVIALECFEDSHGELLVNEVAPRVHNSGHWTQDGSNISQFALHVSCVMNLPPNKGGPKSRTPFFAMANLLGAADGVFTHPKSPPPGHPSQDGFEFFVHDYEKSESRPRRKMGHINATFSPSIRGQTSFEQAKEHVKTHFETYIQKYNQWIKSSL